MFAKVNQWHWLEETGPRLEHADQTHLIMARPKPAQQQQQTKKLGVGGLG